MECFNCKHIYNEDLYEGICPNCGYSEDDFDAEYEKHEPIVDLDISEMYPTKTVDGKTTFDIPKFNLGSVMDKLIADGIPEGDIAIMKLPPSYGKSSFMHQFLLKAIQEGKTIIFSSEGPLPRLLGPEESNNK